MPEFTYRPPSSKTFLHTLRRALAVQGRKDVVELLQGVECEFVTAGRYSGVRWNGYDAELRIRIPIERIPKFTDAIRREILQWADKILPSEVGYDLSAVEVSPVLEEPPDDDATVLPPPETRPATTAWVPTLYSEAIEEAVAHDPSEETLGGRFARDVRPSQVLDTATTPLIKEDGGARQLSTPAPRLPSGAVAEIHEAVIRLDLGRRALLGGVNVAFIGRLDVATKPAEQILLDLHALNGTDRLTDGTDPLETWLRNAEMLSSSLPESRIFARYLRLLPRLNDAQASSLRPLTLDEAIRAIRQVATARTTDVGNIHSAPVSPFGTESYRALVTDELGVIYCHATGYRRAQAFYARKGIGWFYESVLGGASSPLGLPISNEEVVDQTRGATSFFEGGRITWSPGTSVARALLSQDDGSETLLAERRL